MYIFLELNHGIQGPVSVLLSPIAGHVGSIFLCHEASIKNVLFNGWCSQLYIIECTNATKLYTWKCLFKMLNFMLCMFYYNNKNTKIKNLSLTLLKLNSYLPIGNPWLDKFKLANGHSTGETWQQAFLHKHLWHEKACWFSTPQRGAQTAARKITKAWNQLGLYAISVTNLRQCLGKPGGSKQSKMLPVTS